nr:MAG TPA: hypothetical protein [Bacteriophage sp.]
MWKMHKTVGFKYPHHVQFYTIYTTVSILFQH